MILKANWQYLLIGLGGGGGYSGYRVAKRIQAGHPPVNPPNGKGTDVPPGSAWSRSAPPITYDAKGYICAFWSLTAQDSISAQTFAQVLPGANANASFLGGLWTITATAYYVWDVVNAGPNGDNEVLIDAFDIQAAAFIPDDFVDVAPDDQCGTLTTDANNSGYLDTDTQIAEGNQITITARGLLALNRQFGYWQAVPGLLVSSNSKTPATVGSPDSGDIVAHYNDVVVAFAFYNEVPPPALPAIVVHSLYPILMLAPSDGGLVPMPVGGGGDPGPGSPMSTLTTAVRLLQDAKLVGVDLRKAILSGAEKMALQAVKEIQNQLKH